MCAIQKQKQKEITVVFNGLTSEMSRYICYGIIQENVKPLIYKISQIPFIFPPLAPTSCHDFSISFTEDWLLILL